tara:strand:- start:1039 stop:1986 length:948 start_codon:yes stop_codon:yes gene_type:complete
MAHVFPIDQTVHLTVACKASLCTLSHTSLGSFGTFAITVYPRGACQKFEEAPGHVLVSGREDCVDRIVFPMKATFSDNRKVGVVFRALQSVNGSAYVGYVETDQVKLGANSWNSLADDGLTWVRLELVVEFSELENKDAFPLYNHVKEALKKSPLMIKLKCTTPAAIATFCAAGKFKGNIVTAHQHAQMAVRADMPKAPPPHSPADTQAMSNVMSSLGNLYQSLEADSQYYSQRLKDRIVFIDPEPSNVADIDRAVSKLHGLLQYTCIRCSCWHMGPYCLRGSSHPRIREFAHTGPSLTTRPSSPRRSSSSCCAQ